MTPSLGIEPGPHCWEASALTTAPSLHSFQNNKLPGNDGLPIEFYKTCWNLMNESFMECVKESFKYGEMSSSQKKAVVNLIEKQGKDRTLIANWRPISLINVDAKIISKGLEINSSKTEGMWIGSQKNNDEKPLGINWPSEPIKALGVFFTYDQALLYEKNFQHRLDNMKKLTNIWSSRGLSIYGKVTIIKSLLIPKLVYVSSLLPTPLKIIKQVNHIIFTFLWKGKDKVTRLSAINTLE